jgi:hypothetical protein
MCEDAELITNLFQGDHESKLAFASSDLAYFPDQQNGTYNNMISYDFLSASSDVIDISEAFLEIPYTIAPPAGTFSATPIVAFKDSFLSAFHGVQVQLDGKMIVNEVGTEMISAIRLALQQSGDWAVGCKDQLYHSKEYTAPQIQSGLTTSAALSNPTTAMWNALPAFTAGCVQGLSPLCNYGFMERNLAVINSAVATGGSIGTGGIVSTAYVPVMYITDFLRKLGLITNCRFQLTILFNGKNSGNPFVPVVTGKTLAGTGTVIENTTNGANFQITGQTKLWYRRVKFNAEQTKLFEEKLSNGGFSKTISFIETDFYSTYTNVTTTNAFQHLLSAASVAPQRIWGVVIPGATGLVNTFNWPSPIATGQFGLMNLNVNIANTPYFSNTYTSLNQLWDSLKDQMPKVFDGLDNTSQISYGDFLNTHRIHCLDVSRIKDQSRDPNTPVSIVVTGNVTSVNGASVDVLWAVERARKVIISFGRGKVDVQLGPNL